jgi:hypothetical protein
MLFVNFFFVLFMAWFHLRRDILDVLVDQGTLRIIRQSLCTVAPMEGGDWRGSNSGR